MDLLLHVCIESYQVQSIRLKIRSTVNKLPSSHSPPKKNQNQNQKYIKPKTKKNQNKPTTKKKPTKTEKKKKPQQATLFFFSFFLEGGGKAEVWRHIPLNGLTTKYSDYIMLIVPTTRFKQILTFRAGTPGSILFLVITSFKIVWF